MYILFVFGLVMSVVLVIVYCTRLSFERFSLFSYDYNLFNVIYSITKEIIYKHLRDLASPTLVDIVHLESGLISLFLFP